MPAGVGVRASAVAGCWFFNDIQISENKMVQKHRGFSLKMVAIVEMYLATQAPTKTF